MNNLFSLVLFSSYLISFNLFYVSIAGANSSISSSSNASSVMLETSTYTPPSRGYDGRSGNVIVRLRNSCYGINISGGDRPVSPVSILEASLKIKKGNQDLDIKASYPSEIVAANGSSVTLPYSLPNSKKDPSTIDAKIFGNMIEFSIPISYFSDSKGKLSIVSSSFSQSDASCDPVTNKPILGFQQYPVPSYLCQDYMTQAGLVNSTILAGATVSSDQNQIEVAVSFPGGLGFCGSTVLPPDSDPLMIFTNDARPSFNHISSFPLYKGKKTYWPEAGFKGYFLALDIDKSGKIDTRDELFADSYKHANGFEALKVIDTNKDNFIDESDKLFSKLVLWNDLNGNGISEKKEMVKMSKLIKKINLNYDLSELKPNGKYAIERGQAKVVTRDNKQWNLVDIWFEPVLKSNEQSKLTRK